MRTSKRAQENSKAAEAVITDVKYTSDNPKHGGCITMAMAKGRIKQALNISRIGEARLSEIIDLVQASGKVEVGAGVLGWKADFEEVPHAGTPPGSEDPVENKRKRPVEPPRGPSGFAHMGMLLSAQLRDQSADMGPGRGAAVLFCHCPHCGGEVRVEASVRGGDE